MDFVIFGHALYERALSMHYGSTGRGILIDVDAAYFNWDMPQRVRHLDARLAALLADPAQLTSTALLHPVPVKGIPGWDVANEAADYYLDTQQFRPGRRVRAAGAGAGLGADLSADLSARLSSRTGASVTA